MALTRSPSSLGYSSQADDKHGNFENGNLVPRRALDEPLLTGIEEVLQVSHKLLVALRAVLVDLRVVVDERVLHIDLRSEAKAWIQASRVHDARLAEVGGLVLGHDLNEDSEHADEEAAQAQVEDGVEQADFAPAGAIATAKLLRARVPDEAADAAELGLFHFVVVGVIERVLVFVAHC